MANRSDKKAKQRLKRDRKRQALRKASAVSPYKKAAHGRQMAVWANADWRERGQASVFVLREKPGGGLAMAGFLVDLWCAGLKDAWGRLDVFREEFDEIVDRMGERMDDSMAEVPLAEAAGIVAGGIRFAVRNGFRLPAHYTRWTAFLGPLDPDHADLAHFGVEGGTNLRWVAPLEDLRRRLIGSTVEEFLARKDVEFVLGVGDDLGEFAPALEGDDEDEDEDDDEGDDDLDDTEADDPAAGPVADAPASSLSGNEAIPYESVRRSSERVAAGVRQWCFSEGLTPSPYLALAAGLSTAAHMTDLAREAEGEAVEWASGVQHPVIANALAAMPEANRPALLEAMSQIGRFASQFHTPEAMEAALRRLDPPVRGQSGTTEPPTLGNEGQTV